MSEHTSRVNGPSYTIYVMGKKYEVPAGLTIMKSMEYAGYRFTRGCGCRGGVCGACATVYRVGDNPKWHICLACQTNAEDRMHVVQLPYTPAYRALYDIASMECSPQALLEKYPTLKRCMGCNTCTQSCPVGLNVLDYVSALLVGDFETAKELSMECILCGMCAMRCPGELAPMNMALMIRRLMGKKAHVNSAEFTRRLQDIRNGRWDAQIAEYKKMTKDELQHIYKEFQSTKGDAV